MTKKIRILLITVLGIIAAVCASVVAGCKFNYTVEEYMDMYGLSVRVTYFLNLNDGKGGKFNDSNYFKDMYYREGEIALELGSVTPESGFSELSINAGYTFDGWYYVELDNDGNPLYSDGSVYSEADGYDADKGMKVGEKFDFKKPLVKDTHIYICGSFFEDIKLRIGFFCGEGDFDVEYKTTDSDGNEVTKTYKEGEVIGELSYTIPKTGLADVSSLVSESLKGSYTVMGIYESITDENVFSGWPMPYPEPDDDGVFHDVIIYAKLLEGNYTLVSTREQVKSMFTSLTGNYYLMQDIDCLVIDPADNTEKPMEIATRSTFTGSIYGGSEGHTISNCVFVRSSTLRAGESASMFGTLKSGVQFKNVTFENFSVEITVMSGQEADQINLLANEIEDGVVFDNFAINNCELKITESNTNLTYLDEDSWIFSTATIPDGVIVGNVQCLVNGENAFNNESATTNTVINKTEDQ